MDNAEEIKKLEKELEAAKKRLAKAKSKAKSAGKSKGNAKKPVCEPPKTGVTELCFVVDRSGSMGGRTGAVISGFNETLAKQKAKKVDRLIVSTVLFDDETSVLHDHEPVDNVRDMTCEDYRPDGRTALLDAVGGAIDHMVKRQKNAQPADRAENVVFVIITDGLENASRTYSNDKVRRMVEKERDQYGWEFVFIGANIDSFAAARTLGIRRDRTSNFYGDEDGTKEAFCCVSDVAMMKRMKAPSLCVSERMVRMERAFEDRAKSGKPSAKPLKAVRKAK